MCVEILHTHCLINISINSFKLKAQIELNSISMSKNDPKITEFEKYDVEATIDEVDNNDELSVYKYGFTALSNPKNVRLSIEGVARISGDTIERNEILEKDENDVPKILSMIYQELFPTFFLLSKTMNVSCPPHQIGTMGETLEKDVEAPEETVEAVEETVEMSDENETPETELPQETTIESEPETDVQNDSEEQETPDVVQPSV